MVNYTYAYLFAALIFLIIWAILFYWRKDTRKEMLTISIIFGIVALLVEGVYLFDWWRPLTITGTAIGIEDIIFGFSIGGIASIVYEEVFGKRLRNIKKKSKNKDIKFILLNIFLLIVFFGSFFLLKLNSFYASLIALSLGIIIIWIQRKDLIKNSLLSGILLVIIAFPAFIFLEYFFKGAIDKFWYFQFFTKIKIIGMPLEDLIWFFLVGANIGPLWEYWQEKKLVDKK